jgi:RHS repeat-associated protein
VGNLAAILDAKNQRIEYSYDDAGRLVESRYFSAEDHNIPEKTVTFTYDRLGNLTGYDDSVTSAQYVYDDVCRKVSETVDYGAFQLGFSYIYYKNGTKKSFTGPDGITYSYTYDSNDQLKTIEIPNKGYISYNSYIWNRPESISFPRGTTRQYDYDPLMRVKQIQAKNPEQDSILSYVYKYDGMGNMISKKTEHGNYTYGYDDLYRLTEANAPHRSPEAFTYDPVGNRLTSADVTGLWNYSANNELLSYNESYFDYDDNGNTIRKTVGVDPPSAEVTNYIYNVQDRLIRVEDGNGSVIASYYYDPFGRRLWKEISGVRTYFVYADEGLTAEADATGSILKSYGYQPGSQWSTNPLVMKQGQDYYFYHNDHLGSPLLMTSATGATVWSAYYDAFGKVSINSSSDVTNNLRFPGQYYDTESALHYNYQRYYSPKAGRYLRTDPIGFDRGYENFYAYVLNDPINSIDCMGLQKESYNKDKQNMDSLRDFVDSWKNVANKFAFGEKWPSRIVRENIDDDEISKILEMSNPVNMVHFWMKKIIDIYEDIIDEITEVNGGSDAENAKCK